jgi:hypothetical protein
MARWTHQLFTLAMGHKSFKDGAAAIDLTTGKVVPATTGGNLFVIGEFDEQIDATAADNLVNVNLGMEIEVVLWENDNTIDATDIGHIAFFTDDCTVSALEGGPVAGRIWGLDPYGVWIEKLQTTPSASVGGEGGSFVEGALPAWAANDAAVPAHTPNQSAFDVPTTTAASTVTLGAATEGDVLYFSADGTHNGHTVQYRDGVNANALLTTQLTALKRHLVIALFLNGVWRANAYVSP